MELELNRPLIVFDLETTGTNVATDRIVEIGIVQIFPDGREEDKRYLVNPTVPIPPEVTAIHGITNEDVMNEPTFAQLAGELNEYMKHCDFAGFNSVRFDFPLLVEEFLRSNVDFDSDSRKFVDVQRIFHTMEPRNLSAAYKFYCDKELENAHTAMADTKATYEILKAQLIRYPQISNQIDKLSEFAGKTNLVDFGGRFIYDNNKVPLFNFGKHKGKPVTQVLQNEPSYYDWMMNSDFALDTKRKLAQIKLLMLNK